MKSYCVLYSQNLLKCIHEQIKTKLDGGMRRDVSVSAALLQASPETLHGGKGPSSLCCSTLDDVTAEFMAAFHIDNMCNGKKVTTSNP